MNLRRLVLGVLFAIVVLIASAVGFVVWQNFSGPEPPADVVVSAPQLEATNEGQRVFRIDPNLTTARYQAFEELLDASVGSPIGETSAVAGDILVDPINPGNSKFGIIVVNVESLKSDSNMRDSRLRKDFLESSKYPEVELRFGQAFHLPDSLEQGQEYALRLEGDLTVKEITAPTVWDVTFDFNDEYLRAFAETEILMSTYGVGPISIAGFLNTKDEVLLSIDLVAYDVASGGVSVAAADEEVPAVSVYDGDGPSFAEEILPILSSTCAGCHQTGEVGSGHWTLETAADAAMFADDLALVTGLGYMPPWKPGGATPKLLHERGLTEEQLAVLQEWAAAGAPLDVAPDSLVPPSETEAVQMRADLILEMSEPYQGTGELTDDYRCFLLDPSLQEDTFLTGFSLEPGA